MASVLQREAAIKTFLAGEKDSIAICEEYGVSRTTFYRWLKKYDEKYFDEKEYDLLLEENAALRYEVRELKEALIEVIFRQDTGQEE